MRILIAMGLLAIAIAAQGQQIYRWVDASGKVHYTADKPPPGARATSPVASRISAVGANNAPADAQAAREAAMAARPPVKLYATDWCPYCKQVRAFFSRNGIPYTEIDVEKTDGGKAAYRDIGGKSVPIIFVGAQRLDGYNQARLIQALRAAGY